MARRVLLVDLDCLGEEDSVELLENLVILVLRVKVTLAFLETEAFLAFQGQRELQDHQDLQGQV